MIGPDSPASFEIGRIPFEERRIRGFWPAILETWKLATFEPARFYPAVGRSQDATSAILFYLTIGLATIFVSSSLRFMVGTMLLPLRILYGHPGGFSFLGSTLSMFFALLFSPVLLFLFLFMMTGFTHLFLLLVGGAGKGFSATLGAFAYSSAPNIFPIIGWIWSSVVLVIGLARAHETETWRPVVALTLEGIFLTLIVLIPIVFLAMFFFHSFSTPGRVL